MTLFFRTSVTKSLNIKNEENSDIMISKNQATIIIHTHTRTRTHVYKSTALIT